jgi:hypothetical protein
MDLSATDEPECQPGGRLEAAWEHELLGARAVAVARRGGGELAHRRDMGSPISWH